jgi:hemerythrin-like domain-containing protein
MANQLIPPERQDNILECFEAIEEEESGAGEHEKYAALADKLEKETGLK